MRLIPLLYLSRQVRNLSWRDVLWGYERQMMGWSDIVEFALDRLTAGSNAPLEIELASLGKADAHQVGILLRQLADSEEEVTGRSSPRKWLFVLLAWVFDNRTSIPDPLAEVEAIYADFDYPRELEDFVRYMPPTDGYDSSKHSKAENEARLYEQWKKYLDTVRHEFGTPVLPDARSTP